MEQFDLKKWESGDYDVVTRDGKKARIICTDRNVEEYSIIALITGDDCLEEKIKSYTCNGRHVSDKYVDDHDLFLVKKKWKPEHGHVMFYIDRKLDVTWMVYNMFNDEHIKLIKAGNCFEMHKEAEEMAVKMRELLK